MTGQARLWVVVALLACAAGSGPARAQDKSTAEAFLRDMYSGYTTGRHAPNPAGRDAPRFFAPSLLSLIRADQALAAGEAGILDLDPICACQDYDRLEQLKYTVATTGPYGVSASVTFKNSATSTTVQFSLVASDGQWRIADIAEPGMKSMRRFLADGIVSRVRELAR